MLFILYTYKLRQLSNTPWNRIFLYSKIYLKWKKNIFEGALIVIIICMFIFLDVPKHLKVYTDKLINFVFGEEDK